MGVVCTQGDKAYATLSTLWTQRDTRFFFISTPFFSAQPGVAYRETIFEPQVCLDVCLTNQRTFVYEITKR